MEQNYESGFNDHTDLRHVRRTATVLVSHTFYRILPQLSKVNHHRSEGHRTSKEDRTFSAHAFSRKLTPLATRAHHHQQSPLSSINTLGGKVLVLNQSYEPVSVCSVKKAVMLVFLSKAEMVEARSGSAVHTIRYSYPFPSVIRLQSFIRVPYKKVELSRKNILRRDSFRCQYCGSHAHPLTIDHIIPRSRGGNDSWENLVAACVPCNNRKGNRTPEEAGFRLLSIPRKPNHIIFLKHFMGKVDEPWRPYLFID